MWEPLCCKQWLQMQREQSIWEGQAVLLLHRGAVVATLTLNARWFLLGVVRVGLLVFDSYRALH